MRSLSPLRVLLSALLLCSLFGCSDGGGGGGASNATRIVGTWRLRSLRLDTGASVTCPGSLTVDNGNGTITCGVNDTSVFRSDGTFTNTGGGPGTYTVNGDSLTSNFSAQPPLSQTVTVRFDGDQMTQTVLAPSGDTVYAVFEKQAD